MPIRLPVVAGILGLLVAVRYLTRRLNPTLIKLPGGRRVRLLSAVAVRDRANSGVLALEYVSGLTEATPDELETEAVELLDAVSERPEYALCAEAIVVVRMPEEDPELPAPEGRELGFRRFGPTSQWYSIGRSE
jgi:hypothetical protein